MVNIHNINIVLKTGKTVIKDFSIVLRDNDKLALIGEEGNGKSTFLKYLYKPLEVEEYCIASGDISISHNDINYLEQIISKELQNLTILDFLGKKDYDSQLNYEIYNELYKIEKLFKMFNLPVILLDENRKVSSLSGGEKIKLQLVKIAYYPAKLLLVDEPTNDIDIETIELVENYLKTQPIPLIFVSHDETLLTNVANKILHIELIKNKTETIFTYDNVDYQTYLINRASRISNQNAEAYRSEREKQKKLEILAHQHQLVENGLNQCVRDPSTGRIMAKKMKNILSQEKKINNKETVEYFEPEDAINLFFNSEISVPNSKMILNIEHLDVFLDNVLLIKDVNLFIKGPRKITIIGNNGTGKTTLIREIVKILEKTPSISVGYMKQNYAEEFNKSITPLDYLCSFLGYDKETKSKIRAYLGSINFVSEEMLKPIEFLSGGQQAKLYLLSLVVSNKNVLVLDEPTRNISPLSAPIIRKILKDYKGAIIAVSHDRKFVNEVSDEVYVVENQTFSNIKDKHF